MAAKVRVDLTPAQARCVWEALVALDASYGVGEYVETAGAVLQRTTRAVWTAAEAAGVTL